MSVPHGSRAAGFSLLAILLPFGVVSEKPAWTHEMCWWNSPSEECMAFYIPPGHSGVPTNRCGKLSIDTEAQCAAQTDSAGRACFWSTEYESCSERICSNFNQTVCATSGAPPFNCQWDGYECVASNTKCENTGNYSSEASCAADGIGVGPCLWKSAYSPSCLHLSCPDSKNESSCIAATSQVPAMTFILGSAPYGKTPCHWDGSACSQIYHCPNYKSQAECAADSAGFGSCLWDVIGPKCVDMLTCSAYADQTSCVADSYNAAARKNPKAQCWWKAAPAALAVGSAIEITNIVFKDQGPVPTSGNFEINDDRTLKIIDKAFLLEIELGFSFTGRIVMQVTNTAGDVQAWTAIPKPIPDGYTIQLNGACDDNLPKASDYMSPNIDCASFSNQEACGPDLANSTSNSTSSGSTASTSSGSTSSGSTIGSTTASTIGSTSSGSTTGTVASFAHTLRSEAFILMLCLAVKSAH